jgi:hypothetical protein
VDNQNGRTEFRNPCSGQLASVNQEMLVPRKLLSSLEFAHQLDALLEGRDQ